MKERIAEFIREKAYKPLTFSELAMAMGITEKQYPQLQKTLDQMEAIGEIVRTRTERYGAPERMNLAVGRLQGHPKGFGFLVPDAPDAEDVFIGRESLNGAWHGDRVIARLSPPTRMGGRVEGEIIRILQRANPRVVGTFESAKHAGYVTPDDRRLPDDIFIPKGATNGAKSGEKVVVQVVEWPVARRNAEGKVVERIGMKGQVGVDITSVIRKYGLPEAFPPKVLLEAESISDVVPDEAAVEAGRRDLRDWTIVTIDGEDAKDLDDAVNVEQIDEDLWRLGVHIADVAYYVKEGSLLDREAYSRGTSVYLADRVVPMLPSKLSNGICSLNPQVERLTLSCVMEINRDGKVLRYEIFPSVIKTVARMTYAKVNEILAGDPDAVAEYEPLVETFHRMHTLMEVLRTKRERRGAMDFDLPEAKVKLNDQGWPVEIRRVDRGIAERIIEEFMLVANETVAEHVLLQDIPFMYRVHGEPASDRLVGLKTFLALFGYNLKLPGSGEIPPKLLQEVTSWAKGRPEEQLISSVMVRTMRQAVYSEQNIGHFGLAAGFYCHFTSPIRRYPDLVVHRVLRAMLTEGVSTKLKHKWERWMPDAARHASDRERLAMEAERETVDLKKAEFMTDKVGQTFDGVISGVGQFGFFVQLPNTVEGLVHVSTLADDYYHFHEEYYALVGERTRRRFRLGDSAVVRLTRVDVDARQLDFAVELQETPVVTVPTVAARTRSRSTRKQVLAGVPIPAAAPAAEAAGDRKGKGRRGAKGAHVTAVAEAAAKPMALPAARPARKAAEPVPEPAARPAARPAKAAAAGKPGPRPTRSVHLAGGPKRVDRTVVRVGGRVDMWGVPVPDSRQARGKVEDDPGVINPFSLPANAARDGGRGGAPKAIAEAPFAPAPGTADEASGLPGSIGGPVTRARSPRSRRPRRPGGGGAGADQTQPRS